MMDKIRETLLSFFVGLAVIVGIVIAVVIFVYITFNYTWVVLCVFIAWISWLLGRAIRRKGEDE